MGDIFFNAIIALIIVIIVTTISLTAAFLNKNSVSKEELLKHNLAYYSTTNGQFILKDLKGE